MNFQHTADQQAFVDAVDRIAARHRTKSVLGASQLERSPELEADLERASLFDAAGVEELGPVAATAMIVRLAQLPQCLELIASALLLPLHAPALPRPCAVLWDRRRQPARWLSAARTVLCVRGDSVEVASLADGDTVALDSPFGYPVARLRAPDALPWQPLQADAQALRSWWRVGVAAELAGSLGAALDTVVEHVRDRRQFGRPLGAFQAVQHRLAEGAVRVEAMRWLALQAAHSGSAADAAAAAGYAQQAASTLLYDLHQFMGAMGLTLEHPLHRWTTRAKMLRADLGGAEAQYRAVADAAWGAVEEHTA
jgi:alkylation response protein AidB-like acyl-CoA dehydrogenase